MTRQSIFGAIFATLLVLVPAEAEEISSSHTLFSHSYLDLISVLDGGVNQDTPILFDQTLGFSGPLGSMEGFSYLASAHIHFGEDPSVSVGDYQFTDNLEGPDDIELFELWLKYEFEVGDFQLGLIDFNRRFHHLEVAWDLLNSSFSLSPELGGLPVNTFPDISLGAELSVKSDSQFYLLSGVWDGAPVDENNRRGSSIDIGGNQGVFTALELGFNPSEKEKIAIGAWLRNTETDYLQDSLYDRNSGAYFLAQTEIVEHSDIAAFFQASVAEKNRNTTKGYLSGGLVWYEPLPGRAGDSLMFGINRAFTSENYRIESGIEEVSETVLELSYLAEVFSGFYLQPDIQRIFDPVGIPESENAWVFSLRLMLDYERGLF